MTIWAEQRFINISQQQLAGSLISVMRLGPFEVSRSDTILNSNTLKQSLHIVSHQEWAGPNLASLKTERYSQRRYHSDMTLLTKWLPIQRMLLQSFLPHKASWQRQLLLADVNESLLRLSMSVTARKRVTQVTARHKHRELRLQDNIIWMCNYFFKHVVS